MRFCRSSRATRVSPIAGSDTGRSLDIWGLRKLGAQDAALEDGPDAAAKVEDRATAGEGRDLVGEAGGAGYGAAGSLVGEALEDEAAQGGMQLREAAVADRPRLHPLPARQLGLDQRVEQLGLLAQQRRRPQHVLLRRRVDLLQLRDQLPAQEVALVVGLLVAGVIAPGEAAGLAVGGGLLAGGAEQRPRQATVTRTHPQQRPPARRGGEAVENRLDLVVGGVASDDRRPRRLDQPRRRRIARLARPGLQVARTLRAARPLQL